MVWDRLRWIALAAVLMGPAAVLMSSAAVLTSCGGRSAEASVSIYTDFCAVYPDELFYCDQPLFSFEDALARASKAEDLPEDAILVRLQSSNGGGLVPDGRMAHEGYWDFDYVSPGKGTILSVRARYDSVEVKSATSKYSCSADDALKVDDVPKMIRDSAKLAVGRLGEEPAPGYFGFIFQRISECLWVDWGLSYAILNTSPPDTDSGENAYVEHNLDGELVQVCDLGEDCVDPYGMKAP